MPKDLIPGIILPPCFSVNRPKPKAFGRFAEDYPADRIISFNALQAQKNCPHPLRIVVVWNAQKEEKIVLPTNHPTFGASTIAAIYKDRWQIEIFFKTLKQNLKVKTFVGTSENALYIQIWTAMNQNNLFEKSPGHNF